MTDYLQQLEALQSAELLDPRNPSPHSLPAQAAEITAQLARLSPPDPEDYTAAPDPEAATDARSKITTLLSGLAWPVKSPASTAPAGGPHSPLCGPPETQLTALTLTMHKRDLVERLWTLDGGTSGARLIDDMKIVFYVALHGLSEFARYYQNLRVQLLAVHEFYDQQIQTLAERELMVDVCTALWRGHHANLCVPAPAPAGAFTSGN